MKTLKWSLGAPGVEGFPVGAARKQSLDYSEEARKSLGPVQVWRILSSLGLRCPER